MSTCHTAEGTFEKVFLEGNVYVPYPMKICFDLTLGNRNTCQKRNILCTVAKINE